MTIERAASSGHFAVDRAELTGSLTREMVNDVLTSLGWSGIRWLRRLVTPLLWPACHRFAEVLSGADEQIELGGMSEALQWMLPRFARSVEVRGANQVPREGPLLVLANHPGTFDEMVVGASLGRSDLRIIALGWPVLRRLPAASSHLIFTSGDPHQHVTAVRDAIRCLQRGNALLIFPTADLDPDPDVQPGAIESLDRWSPSMELLLRHAPDTKVQVAVVSGVVSPTILRNPLLRMRRDAKNQRIAAEVLQMSLQLLFPGMIRLKPRLSLGEALTVPALAASGGGLGVYHGILAEARRLLAQHAPSAAAVAIS
jgi:hypothetical protein